MTDAEKFADLDAAFRRYRERTDAQLQAAQDERDEATNQRDDAIREAFRWAREAADHVAEIERLRGERDEALKGWRKMDQENQRLVRARLTPEGTQDE